MATVIFWPRQPLSTWPGTAADGDFKLSLRRIRPLTQPHDRDGYHDQSTTRGWVLPGDTRMGSRMGYVIVWDFRVAPGMERQFEQAYGADGEWGTVFPAGPCLHSDGLAPGYTGCGPVSNFNVWEPEAAYKAFRTAHTDEYREIDARCEALTESEPEVGSFVVAAGSHGDAR